MAKGYLPYDLNQRHLLPPDMRSYELMMMRSRAIWSLALPGSAAVLLILGACARHDPPSPTTASASAAPLLPVERAETRAGAAVGQSRAPDAAAEAAPSSPSGPGSDADAGPLFASSPPIDSGSDAEADPSRLPQTRESPRADGAAWEARTRALWDAIVSDDPERALPFFFPLGAYEQVKAIASPASDWKRRLVGAYARDIHELHKKLGADPPKARFVRLDPGPAPRWVEPGEEYNKIGYYRVFGSKLRFTRADGTSGAFDVKSLISWRGEWYVVHLSAFK